MILMGSEVFLQLHSKGNSDHGSSMPGPLILSLPPKTTRGIPAVLLPGNLSFTLPGASLAQPFQNPYVLTELDLQPPQT